MATLAAEPNLNARQRIAAHTPKRLRKAVRMALNYPYRLRMWADLLREIEPADPASRAILRRSALAAPLTALRDLDSYQKPVLRGDIAVKIAGVGRFQIRAGTDDLLHVMTSREPLVRRLIEAELTPGGTFVDGGANIGFYALVAAARIGAGGRVVAFEMMPDTAAILRHHISENGPLPITVIERALSARSGEVVTASVAPGHHGQASIVSDVTAERHSVSVETVTLDEALADLGAIDLIKLDLEGAEYMALSGAAAVLARTRCLVFESNDEDPRIFELLAAAGFAVERLEAHDFVARRRAR